MAIRNILWPDEREVVLEHIRRVYGPADEETASVSYGTMPGFDPADCFVIDGSQPGEIAAHAMIVPRQVQIGASVLPAAEVALLGVLEPYQQQGYEEALLEAIHARMDERGDALALSFGSLAQFEPWGYDYAAGLYMTSFESEIAPELAAKAGEWNPGHAYERRTAERLNTRRRDLTVRRFYLNDLPAVRALYAAESECGYYLIGRDEATWLWQMEYLTRIGRNDPDDFLVVEDGDRLLAYARLVTQGQVNAFRESEAARFNVIEVCGSDPDALEALLAEIGRSAQTLNADRIGLFVHPESAFFQHALARGGTLRHFTGAALLRPHDLPLALDLLGPALEVRCQQCRCATRSVRLVLASETERAEILLGSGGDAETVELEAPAISLLRLMTGWYGLDHLNNGYHERHADLLRALFPRRDPKIGLADVM